MADECFEVALKIIRSRFHSSLSCKDVTPVKATEGSVGFDLFLPRMVILKPFQTETVSMGIKLSMPEKIYGILSLRSSIAKEGIYLPGGLIDEDYRGEIKAYLFNFNDEDKEFSAGQRVVQIRFHQVAPVRFNLGGPFRITARGENATGSSGTDEILKPE